jgi:hypothetical protein
MRASVFRDGLCRYLCTTSDNPKNLIRQTRELSLAGPNSAAAMTAGTRSWCTGTRMHPAPIHVGLLAFKNVRRWRTAKGTRSFASFQGKNVICAFGASMAVSSATA